MPAFEATKQGYANLWVKMKVRPERVALANTIATRLNANRRRYEIVAHAIGCPWWFVAAIHELEAGGRFNSHLHNGDPLTARTTHVPAGRPVQGQPPFSWEQSADDALRMRGIHKIKDWSVSRALYEWEAYNGWGYLGKVNSPYIWSFSTLYAAGKYIADHVWSSTAVSQQCGCAVILRAMLDLGYVVLETTKENAMQDLQNLLSQFRVIAPTIATAIGGPLAGIVVKAVADQFEEPSNDPAAVKAKIETTPIQEVIKKLSAAENTVRQITPAETPPSPVELPAPVVAVPAVVPVAIELPKGAFGPLDGYVTYIGIAITVAGFALGFTHVITPELSNAILTIGTGIGGAGLINKWEKWRKIVPLLPALPSR